MGQHLSSSFFFVKRLHAHFWWFERFLRYLTLSKRVGYSSIYMALQQHSSLPRKYNLTWNGLSSRILTSVIVRELVFDIFLHSFTQVECGVWVCFTNLAWEGPWSPSGRRPRAVQTCGRVGEQRALTSSSSPGELIQRRHKAQRDQSWMAKRNISLAVGHGTSKVSSWLLLDD